MSRYAVDLGTTNTGVARWDETRQRPELVVLDAVCRQPEGEDPLQAPRVVPSALEVLPQPGWSARLGQWGPLRRRTFWGSLGWIGRPAIERNKGMPRPSFAATFKQALAQSPLQTLAVIDGRAVTAREVARLFVRELLAEVQRGGGPRLRELVLCVPVDAYEGYRAELLALGRWLGLAPLRFIDEPVAAAIGYGLADARRRVVLVVDFGGGTLDLALVRLGGRALDEGAAEVLAKAGLQLGGDDVDQWIVDLVSQRLALPARDAAPSRDWQIWQDLMRYEARRVKEALYLHERETFLLVPPEELRRFEAQLRGEARPVELTREELRTLCEQHGVYQGLERCLAQLAAQAQPLGLELDAVDDVLMVGGSTLLPDIYPQLERRFGRDRVRAWQPFEAVAYGAAIFAGGQQVPSDFIVHDYAFTVHDPGSHEPRHEVIVPRGTRFPTAPDLWKRQLVPTCPLGEPESLYKLVISEIGDSQGSDRRFSWDQAGTLHRVGGNGDTRLVVPLNAANPTLGKLDPPHPPGDTRPRLEVAFGVNGERWLVATVTDLWNQRRLMREEPVVRLL